MCVREKERAAEQVPPHRAAPVIQGVAILRESVCERERFCLCVIERARKKTRERERERERARERMRERERENLWGEWGGVG